MKITDVKIRKTFSEGPMLAVASITFDQAFVVHDVKVIHANDRDFIVMPSRKNADGTYVISRIPSPRSSVPRSRKRFSPLTALPRRKPPQRKPPPKTPKFDL